MHVCQLSYINNFMGSKINNTVKPVLSGHSKVDKTQILKTSSGLLLVESIAECSDHSAIFLTCIKCLSVLKTYFKVFFAWSLKTGFTIYLSESVHFLVFAKRRHFHYTIIVLVVFIVSQVNVHLRVVFFCFVGR